MKSLFLLLVLTLTAALGTHAQDTGSDTLDAANQAYSEGHYDQASRQFQDLIQARGYSAALCFDLANAEAKAGRIGPAILNYERARYLAPSDRDIDHNLQLARQQAGLKPNSLRWWQVALRSLTINQWLAVVDVWLALIALAVISNFFVNRMAVGRNRAMAGKVVKTTLFVAIPLFLFTTYVALLAAPLRIEGVVMSKDAPLRLSPFDAAEQIGTLPEGELVTVEQKHDNYFRIEARDGRYGWMTRQSLEPVIAGSFDLSAGQ
jgi:tetratricopeptide (TPR) repeat protein